VIIAAPSEAWRVAEFDDPVMIVVGGGAIALSTAQELCALHGHHVVVLWRRDPDFARAVKSIGAEFVSAAHPDSVRVEHVAAAPISGHHRGPHG
jgi:hypothetical protein